MLIQNQWKLTECIISAVTIMLTIIYVVNEFGTPKPKYLTLKSNEDTKSSLAYFQLKFKNI